MKIIHTADIHLDSPLSQVKDPVKRRYELLQALANLSVFCNYCGGRFVRRQVYYRANNQQCCADY